MHMEGKMKKIKLIIILVLLLLTSSCTFQIKTSQNRESDIEKKYDAFKKEYDKTEYTLAKSINIKDEQMSLNVLQNGKSNKLISKLNELLLGVKDNVPYTDNDYKDLIGLQESYKIIQETPCKVVDNLSEDELNRFYEILLELNNVKENYGKLKP